MFIHWLEFENDSTGLKIKRISFDRLNLLVGVSGAGKTQILKALSTYVGAVVKGDAIPCAGRFVMCFSLMDKQKSRCPAFRGPLTWTIQTNNHSYKSDGSSMYKVSGESVTDSFGDTVFCRTEQSLRIEGREMPQIAPGKSVLNLFQPDIQEGFSQVASLFRQLEGIKDVSIDFAKEQIKQWESNQYGELPLAEVKCRLFQYPPLLAIFLAKRFVPGLYRDFLGALQDSFPYVDEVLVSDKAGNGKSELVISQDGIWIHKSDISGGMLKAICILATSCFAPDGSVILLDELENSLGVNCLDDIVTYIRLKAAENRQQFILTSHHPYIISHIPVENWRIISQKAGVIKSTSSKDAGIETKVNRQDAFFQLINYLDREES